VIHRTRRFASRNFLTLTSFFEIAGMSCRHQKQLAHLSLRLLLLLIIIILFFLLRPLPSLYPLSLSLALHASLSRQSCASTRQLCAGELTAKLVFPLCFSSCRRFQCPPRRCCCCWWLCPRRHERISFLASSDSVLAKQNLRRGVNRFVSQSGGKDLIEASLAIRSSSMPHPFIGYRLSNRSTMHGVSPPTSTVLRPLCSSERNPLLLLLW
jgi:hypothetical protein